jgi:hypothetical protein
MGRCVRARLSADQRPSAAADCTTTARKAHDRTTAANRSGSQTGHPG